MKWFFEWASEHWDFVILALIFSSLPLAIVCYAAYAIASLFVANN